MLIHLSHCVLVSCSGHTSVDTYTCYSECWSVVADTLVFIHLSHCVLVSCSRHISVDTYTCYSECWSVVADTLVLILTPVTVSVGQL